MSATIILNKKHRDDDFGYVSILFVKDKKRKTISLKFRMLEKDFTKYYDKSFKQFRKSNTFDRDYINNLVTESLKKDVFSEQKTQYTFLTYFKSRRDLKKNLNTYNSYNSAYNIIETYLKKLNKEDIKLTDFNTDMVLEFKNYLKEQELEQSTIKAYFNVYNTIFNNAIYSDVVIMKNPFKGIKIKTTPKKKIVLENNDIIKLLNIEPGQQYFYESRMFLLQFFMNGSRISDLLLLKVGEIKSNEILYTMLKTKNEIPVAMSPEISKILIDIFGFNEQHNPTSNNKIIYGNYHLKTFLKRQPSNQLVFKDFVQSDIYNDYVKKNNFTTEQHKHFKVLIVKYNERLKKLCKLYELSETNVSSHNCRHTFTNLLLDMENINVNDLRVLLGHSSLNTTQNYIQTGFRNKKTQSVQTVFRKQFKKD
jgi:integrase